MARNAFATVRFSGDELEPALVSDIVRVKPSIAYCKGETFFVGTNHRKRVGKTGLWLFSTEGMAESADIAVHIKIISKALFGSGTLESKLTRARSIVGLIGSGADMSVSLFWHGAEDDPYPVISENFIYVITTIGGKIETDFGREGDDAISDEIKAA